MKITNKLRRTIESDLFRLYNTTGPRYNYLHDHTLKILVSPFIEGNRFELPVFLYSPDIFKDIIDNTVSIVPIGKGNNSLSYRTADSILNRILNFRGRLNLELISVESDKHGTWQGCSGLLLDKDFNVIIMPVITGNIEGNFCNIDNIKLYVNPRVSIAEQGIEKIVYTKIVPFCITHSCFVTSNTVIPSIKNNINYISDPEIVFKDVKNMFFTTPNTPKSPNINKEINEILEGVKDELKEYI